MRYLFVGALGVLAAALLIAFFALFASAADSASPHGDCAGGVSDIAPVSDNLATYDAGGDTITGVCIKAGNTALHDFYIADVNTGCYTISGIGTSVVTVTRTGEGRECQAISHIDVLIGDPQTPTPTPTPPATTPTPTPTTPASTPTITATPVTPVGTSTFMAPLAFPDTGGEPADDGGLTETLMSVGFVLLGGGLAMGGLWFLLRRRT